MTNNINIMKVKIFEAENTHKLEEDFNIWYEANVRPKIEKTHYAETFVDYGSIEDNYFNHTLVIFYGV